MNIQPRVVNRPAASQCRASSQTLHEPMDSQPRMTHRPAVRRESETHLRHESSQSLRAHRMAALRESQTPLFRESPQTLQVPIDTEPCMTYRPAVRREPSRHESSQSLRVPMDSQQPFDTHRPAARREPETPQCRESPQTLQAPMDSQPRMTYRPAARRQVETPPRHESSQSLRAPMHSQQPRNNYRPAVRSEPETPRRRESSQILQAPMDSQPLMTYRPTTRSRGRSAPMDAMGRVIVTPPAGLRPEWCDTKPFSIARHVSHSVAVRAIFRIRGASRPHTHVPRVVVVAIAESQPAVEMEEVLRWPLHDLSSASSSVRLPRPPAIDGAPRDGPWGTPANGRGSSSEDGVPRDGSWGTQTYDRGSGSSHSASSGRRS